jgi:hypothetical protein
MMTRREKFFATNLAILTLVSALIGAVDSVYVASGLIGIGSAGLMFITYWRDGGIKEGDIAIPIEEEEDDAIVN